MIHLLHQPTVIIVILLFSLLITESFSFTIISTTTTTTVTSLSSNILHSRPSISLTTVPTVQTFLSIHKRVQYLSSKKSGTSTSTSQLSATNTEEDIIMTTFCSESTQELFRNKKVLITGASSGLGRSFALQLAQCGVQTLILTARKEDTLQQVAQECQTIYKTNNNNKKNNDGEKELTIHIITADLSKKESVQNLATKTLEVCPIIDVLINNGGISSRSRFIDTTIDVDERVMQINFLAGATLAKAVVPTMIQQNFGIIIWISSVQGLLAIPNRSSYAASKFAVQGYCESIRAELATSGITVHCVSPGYIRTNLSMSAVTGDGQQYGKIDETTASGADPNDVAITVLNSVTKGKADFVVAANFSATLGIWLRFLFPSLLRSSLVKRYEKSQQQQDKVKDD